MVFKQKLDMIMSVYRNTISLEVSKLNVLLNVS